MDEKRINKVLGDYVVYKEKLGQGSFAKVYLGQHTSTKEFVAVKKIDLTSDKINNRMLEYINQEISIMAQCDHKNIIKLHQRVDKSNRIYVIMEYCAGGDLSHLIHPTKNTNLRLAEPVCRRLLRDLVLGVKFLYDHGIVHRDLKPQNLLLTSSDPTVAVLKIADFGMARPLEADSLAKTCVGTPLYMAPEVLSEAAPYSAYLSDLWSVGVILYEMVTGASPFAASQSKQELRNNIQQALVFPPDLNVSSSCIDLIRALLVIDPKERLGGGGDDLLKLHESVRLGNDQNSDRKKLLAAVTKSFDELLAHPFLQPQASQPQSALPQEPHKAVALDVKTKHVKQQQQAEPSPSQTAGNGNTTGTGSSLSNLPPFTPASHPQRALGHSNLSNHSNHSSHPSHASPHSPKRTSSGPQLPPRTPGRAPTSPSVPGDAKRHTHSSNLAYQGSHSPKHPSQLTGLSPQQLQFQSNQPNLPGYNSSSSSNQAGTPVHIHNPAAATASISKQGGQGYNGSVLDRDREAFQRTGQQRESLVSSFTRSRSMGRMGSNNPSNNHQNNHVNSSSQLRTGTETGQSGTTSVFAAFRESLRDPRAAPGAVNPVHTQGYGPSEREHDLPTRPSSLPDRFFRTQTHASIPQHTHNGQLGSSGSQGSQGGGSQGFYMVQDPANSTQPIQSSQASHRSPQPARFTTIPSWAVHPPAVHRRGSEPPSGRTGLDANNNNNKPPGDSDPARLLAKIRRLLFPKESRPIGPLKLSPGGLGGMSPGSAGGGVAEAIPGLGELVTLADAEALERLRRRMDTAMLVAKCAQEQTRVSAGTSVGLTHLTGSSTTEALQATQSTGQGDVKHQGGPTEPTSTASAAEVKSSNYPKDQAELKWLAGQAAALGLFTYALQLAGEALLALLAWRCTRSGTAVDQALRGELGPGQPGPAEGSVTPSNELGGGENNVRRVASMPFLIGISESTDVQPGGRYMSPQEGLAFGMDAKIALQGDQLRDQLVQQLQQVYTQADRCRLNLLAHPLAKQTPRVATAPQLLLQLAAARARAGAVDEMTTQLDSARENYRDAVCLFELLQSLAKTGPSPAHDRRVLETYVARVRARLAVCQKLSFSHPHHTQGHAGHSAHSLGRLAAGARHHRGRSNSFSHAQSYSNSPYGHNNPSHGHGTYTHSTSSRHTSPVFGAHSGQQGPGSYPNNTAHNAHVNMNSQPRGRSSERSPLQHATPAYDSNSNINTYSYPSPARDQDIPLDWEG